jgi:hypothetical protein
VDLIKSEMGLPVSLFILPNFIERMVSARWSKASRGELVTIPPAGYDIDGSRESVNRSRSIVDGRTMDSQVVGGLLRAGNLSTKKVVRFL